jgi:hypothetical protein
LVGWFVGWLAIWLVKTFIFNTSYLDVSAITLSTEMKEVSFLKKQDT